MSGHDDPDHLLGRILASQARCERGQKESAERLSSMQVKLDELAHERTRGRVLLWIGRGLLGMLLPAVGWILSEHRSADVRITRAETQLVASREVADRQERHAEQQAHDVTKLREDVRGVSATLDEMRSTLRSVDSQLRERRRR